MAAVSTAIIGAAIIGAGATAYSVSEQKKAARKQEARLDEQETEAREIAKLDQTKDSSDADFQLGRSDAAAAVLPGTSPVATGTASSRKGSVKKRVGLGANAAKRVGL